MTMPDDVTVISSVTICDPGLIATTSLNFEVLKWVSALSEELRKHLDLIFLFSGRLLSKERQRTIFC